MKEMVRQEPIEFNEMNVTEMITEIEMRSKVELPSRYLNEMEGVLTNMTLQEMEELISALLAAIGALKEAWEIVKEVFKRCQSQNLNLITKVQSEEEEC